jgi:hypothetical protein
MKIMHRIFSNTDTWNSNWRRGSEERKGKEERGEG